MYWKTCRYHIGLLFIASLAWNEVHAQFMDGHDLRELLAANSRMDQGQEFRGDYEDSIEGIGYVQGVFDAYAGAELLCAPRSTTTGQVMAIVDKYLNENPETWAMPATYLVLSALQEPFDCIRN